MNESGCRATTPTGLRRRDNRGSGTAETASGGAETLHHHLLLLPPPTSSRFLTSPPHPASLLSELLEVSYPSSSSSSPSFGLHPPHTNPSTFCGLASPWIPPTPLLHLQWSAAARLQPHLNMRMYISLLFFILLLLLAGVWSGFTATQLCRS